MLKNGMFTQCFMAEKCLPAALKTGRSFAADLAFYITG